MKLKNIIILTFMTYGSFLAAAQEVTPVAPIVSVIFSNEDKEVEIVGTLVQIGEYFGNKNAGAYYHQLIPAKGIIKRDSFAFDPGALEEGPNVYPFMFTHKGDIYYLVFVTSKILEEKTEFPFFAIILKVISIDEKNNSAEIESVANVYFNQNDTLAIALQPNGLAFGNVTNQTLAGFVNEKQQPIQVVKKRVNLVPKVKPKRRVRLIPTTKPKPVVSLKALQKKSTSPLRHGLLTPKTKPAPARAQ